MIKLFQYCDKGPLFQFAIGCPLSVLASTAFAMSLQPIIDVGMSGDVAAFAVTTVVALLAACADVLFSYLRGVSQKKVVISYTKNLRSHYFETFFRQDIARFLEKDSALYLSKLTVDSEVIGNKYCESILCLYRSLWSLVLSCVCIAMTRWELALFILVISFVSVNLPKLFQNHADAAEQDYLDSSSRHINVAQENIRNYLVIRLFRLIPTQTGRYQKTIRSVAENDIRRHKTSFLVDSVATSVSNISFIGIIALCMVFVLQGKLTVGYTMSVSQLLGGIMFPFEMLPGYLVTYRTGKNIYRAYEEELQQGMKEEGTKPLALTSGENRIVLDNLSFAYYPQQPLILQNISLSLDLNRKYAFVGKSGSGKSTLAKIIMGLLKPTAGTITVNGVPLGDIDKNSLYDAIVYQSQAVSFFDATIQDNIQLGKPLPEETWRRIIQESCLEDLLQKLPEQEKTILSENGKNISGGEAQRICLARCLAAYPRFVIFDEIAAALDTQNAVAIEKSILSLENVGVLHITHRINEENMRRYDTIFVLKEGRISEQGTWDELVEKKGDFYQLAMHMDDACEPV